MIKEAIILAGGLGMRLRSAVPDLPKCMAPVNGRPFIDYLVGHFQDAGIERFIFALGFKSGDFEGFLAAKFQRGPATYALSVEQEPMGTGGAIRMACRCAADDTVLVMNGDTFFRIAPDELADFHSYHGADCTVCLKPMRNFDRYGVVELGSDGRVNQFREKQFYAQGLINGGVYALERRRFLELDLPEKFSFEKDYLERQGTGVTGGAGQRLFGLVQDAYFIDIGIPEDYERAQTEMKSYAT
ncbi:MAG: sugar phosphate nucleotidyltransferase [Bacteroidota bacterium]|nr:sugar phosphate nucleotidyltransferase [Bacteroidota bacterium]MDP4215189.1 sugar phosphate nucleotidyltransferase [Bacteroidota bacterium]MDP4244982.1 sugar phosphate nucleotidyltransferase [Bacteroidota bacterium]MDP4255456.1 sugar phosphate nucleotidyltransferase [Bacteroidota bacterium]MDP4256711.1 sugar phosphate nucleotidyltransferase [Bacteroidota bacterium]